MVPITTECPCFKLAKKGVSSPCRVPTLLEVSQPGPQEWQAGPCLARV